MALVLWAKTAAGTNFAFIKGLGKSLKVWKNVLHQFKRAQPIKAKTKIAHPLAKEKCNNTRYALTNQIKVPESLRSRVFRSLFARTTSYTAGREIRRRVACELSSAQVQTFRRVPLLSLIGVTIGVDAASIINNNTEHVMEEMKGMFSEYGWHAEALDNPPKSLGDLEMSLESLASGCEGAVYKAKVKAADEVACFGKGDDDYNLAVKAVFNYGATSNAESILREMRREYVPLHMNGVPESSIVAERVGRLPPHPNIVDMPGIFEDDVLVTEEGLKKFPAALPRRIDPENCCGHNKTLYVVMRRRSTHLRDYLATYNVSMEDRCLLLAQLLEGVSHLVQHGIAHRDLKADNILVDIPKNGGAAKLEICDFGCCLAEENRKLSVAYPCEDMYKGGNSWLMAPEIATTKPGPDVMLDYTKSDLWAAGTIAYEILGSENPFYPSKDPTRQQLSTWTYTDEDIPILPDNVPEPVQRLVYTLLSRNPKERPSAGVAAAVAQIVVLQSGQAAPIDKAVHQLGLKGECHSKTQQTKPAPVLMANKERDSFQWMMVQSLSLLCQLILGKDKGDVWDVPSVMRFLFLSRLTHADFRESLSYF